jgi:uncharacterized RDD family membrane protein YckC
MENRKEYKVTSNVLASQGQRFVNYIVDVVFIYIIIFTLIFGISVITTLLGSDAFVNWTQDINDLEGYAVFFIIFIPYFALSEGLLSRSFSKYITKTKVVNEDGSNITLITAFKRTFCRIIPMEQFSFFGADARGWHDSITDTYVVKKEVFERNKKLFDEFDEIGKISEIE